MRLLELLLVEHAQPRLLVPLLNSPEIGAKFGGFLHELVLELCGAHRLNLMVADASAYGFSPKHMVSQVLLMCCYYSAYGFSPKHMVSQVAATLALAAPMCCQCVANVLLMCC
jgi:hypothetical protein